MFPPDICGPPFKCLCNIRMNGPLEKILELCGKNKMRVNEVFEPVVKYPYAVLQCNGLLDE